MVRLSVDGILLVLLLAPRPVEGRLGSLGDEEVVEEASEESSDNGGDPSTPDEVAIAVGPDLTRVTECGSSYTRTEVTSRVEAVRGLGSESGSNTENQEHEHESVGSSRHGVVVGVSERENDGEEDGSGNHLGEEGRDVGKVRLSSSEEEGGSRGGSSESTDTGTSLELVHKVVVVGLDEYGSQESTNDLTQNVARYFAPGESTEGSERDSDGRVEMSTRDSTGSVDTEHDTDTPSEGDGEVRTLSELREHDLTVDTVTEEDKNTCTKDLC